MASTNQIPGLARGPFDHEASSVINLISNATIAMGDGVILDQSGFNAKTIIPSVGPGASIGSGLIYGIAVGGDVDGVYGDGSAPTDDTTRATNGSGQGVVVVTQGRCLARVGGAVGGAIVIGDELVLSAVSGVLQKHSAAGQTVIALSMNSVLAGDTDMILVDVQRSVRHAA